jgi:negative regulator of sigma E activity
MDPQQRLKEAADNAKRAEGQGDDPLAASEWRRYRLIKDAMRDPDELLNEGIALSGMAIELASQT